jgi:hypothetical protein
VPEPELKQKTRPLTVCNMRRRANHGISGNINGVADEIVAKLIITILIPK